MNGAAIITAVRNRVGISSTDARAADTELIEIINEAIAAISTERDWPWLETTRSASTVAGTATIATGTRWVRTRQLQIDTYAPMQPETRRQLDHWFPTSTDRGLPQYWCVSGDLIRLYPTPDAVYAVTEVFTQYEPTITTADTPLMPSQFHTAIVEWAASILLTRLREDERAAIAMSRAQDWLKRMADDGLRSSTPIRVRIRGGSFI